MPLVSIASRLPEYANDIKLNLSSALLQTELTPAQLWGTLVASACACGNQEVIREVIQEASGVLTPQQLTAAKAAAGIMAMNNVFYRFNHLCSNERYRTLPAKLRMNIIRSHGVDQIDFELWCTAVSAINSCGACVDAHERVLREKGLAEENVHASVRIASVIHAVSAILCAEAGSAS